MTYPSFAIEDGARRHCSCFKFELESFLFPRRRIGIRVYLPSLRNLQLGGSSLQICSLGIHCRQICSRYKHNQNFWDTTRTVTWAGSGLKFGRVHKRLKAMPRWDSAFDSEFENRGCISPNSENGLIVFHTSTWIIIKQKIRAGWWQIWFRQTSSTEVSNPFVGNRWFSKIRLNMTHVTSYLHDSKHQSRSEKLTREVIRPSIPVRCYWALFLCLNNENKATFWISRWWRTSFGSSCSWSWSAFQWKLMNFRLVQSRKTTIQMNFYHHQVDERNRW